MNEMITNEITNNPQLKMAFKKPVDFQKFIKAKE
jgi:hypothetical protein